MWELIQAWTNNFIMKPSVTMGIEEWWTQDVHLATKEQRRTWAAINMYTVWTIWKERNRRTFDDREADSVTVLQLIKEEMNLRFLACGTPVVSSF